MGYLTTHVLDTALGRPASGMRVQLYRLQDGREPEPIVTTLLNADGRCDQPLLEDKTFIPGRYRLVFSVADYFRHASVPLSDPPFLDEVPIDFGIADASAHYHVPLLASPWSYSTYRGS